MKMIRNFITGVKNFITWFPVIWNDRQWDQSFMLDMMIKKLSLMEEYFRTSNIIVEEESKEIADQIYQARAALEQLRYESHEKFGYAKYYEKYPIPKENFLSYLNADRPKEQNELYDKCRKLSEKYHSEYLELFFDAFKNYRGWWD